MQAFRQNLGTRIGYCVGKFSRKQDAAEAAGVSVEQLNKWVKGSVKVPVEGLAQLAAAADVDFSWLSTGEGKQPVGGLTRVRKAATDLDVPRLERAIAVVERGLEEAGRTAPPEVKAELVNAVYALLENQPSADIGPILRLVKG